MRIIRGKYGRRRFTVPSNITARPTTDFARENIFNIIENLIDIENIRALDLFAGTGAITFELLSRGAASVTSIEKAATQYRFIQKTAQTLQESNLRLIKGDVFRILESSPTDRYDLIFCDPPYDHPRFDEVAALVLNANILAPGGIFILEHSKAHDYSSLPTFHRHVAYGSVNFSIFTSGPAIP